jgi:PAS domain S-box-containing protein
MKTPARIAELATEVERLRRELDRAQQSERRALTERDLWLDSPVVVVRRRNEESWPVDYVSPNVLDLVGFSVSELTSGLVRFTSIIHPEDAPRVLDATLQHIARHVDDFGQEYRLLRSDGNVVWVQDRTRIVRQDGVVTEFRSYLLDVSARKRAEDALRESETRFRTMADQAPIMIGMTDALGQIVFLNKSWLDFRGTTFDEETGWAWTACLHPDDRDQTLRAMQSAMDSLEPSSIEFRVQDRHGEYHWMLAAARPYFDAHGLAKGYIATAVNISEQRHAREERDLLFSLSIDPLCIAGFDGYLKQLNPAWTNLLGWTTEELQREPWLSFVHPDDRAATLAAGEQLGAGQPVLGFENRYRCKDGSYRILAWNSFPLLAEGIIIGVVRDLTETRQLEERLRQTEKMEAVGQLAGGVAHDFNNQLTAILGYGELLAQRLAGQDLKRYADNIVATSRRAAELTQQLLAFARRGKYRVVTVDIHALIREIVMLLMRSIDRRIEIKQRLEAESALVMGDPTQLQNALLHLALNARDAMPEGGELSFATQTITLDERDHTRQPHDVRPGRHVEITVRDSGSGMDPDTLRRVFEPFFTTKQAGRGSGMGLPAVYGTVKSHQGTIEMSSRVGQGTTCVICLPLCTPAESAGQGVVLAPGRGAGARLLVVDDEEAVRQLMVDVLEEEGYRVTTCRDGVEALERYQQHWAEIDLVILDMVMPHLSGRELFRALRRINPRLKALIASGYSLDEEAQSIIAEGVLGCIQKPFRRAELLTAVQIALQLERTPAAS